VQVSKERARRRAEREAEAARRAALRQRRVATLARRRARRERLLGWLPRRRRGGTGRPSLLAAKRRRRIGLLALGFLLVQFLVWVSTPDWGVRVGVLVVSVLAMPLAAALTL
jgi:hypothetical protein